MKFYRVSKRQEGGNSAGYVFTTSRRAAERIVREEVKNDPQEYEDGPPDIHVLMMKPTKHDILIALNCYASHPGNG